MPQAEQHEQARQYEKSDRPGERDIARKPFIFGRTGLFQFRIGLENDVGRSVPVGFVECQPVAVDERNAPVPPVHRRVQHNLPSRLRTAGKRNRRNRDVAGEAADDRRLAPFAETTPDPAAQRFRNVNGPPSGLRDVSHRRTRLLSGSQESVGAILRFDQLQPTLKAILRDSGRTHRHRPGRRQKMQLSGVSGRHGSRLGQTKLRPRLSGLDFHIDSQRLRPGRAFDQSGQNNQQPLPHDGRYPVKRTAHPDIQRLPVRIQRQHVETVGGNVMRRRAERHQPEKSQRDLEKERSGNRERNPGKPRPQQQLHRNDPPALGFQQIDKRTPERFYDPRQVKPTGVQRDIGIGYPHPLVQDYRNGHHRHVRQPLGEVQRGNPCPRRSFQVLHLFSINGRRPEAAPNQ